MLNSDSENYSYAESINGLQWSDTIFLGLADAPRKPSG